MEVGIRKAAVHELLEGGGGGLSESGGQLIHVWINMACNTHSEQREQQDIRGRRVWWVPMWLSPAKCSFLLY